MAGAPIQTVFGNLVVARDLSDVWAVFRGRCAMLALTIADIKTGRIRPGHPRYQRGNEHLGGCWRCRSTTPIDARQAA